jgi:hypothetical protein
MQLKVFIESSGMMEREIRGKLAEGWRLISVHPVTFKKVRGGANEGGMEISEVCAYLVRD